jgi:hypothetical protein
MVTEIRQGLASKWLLSAGRNGLAGYAYDNSSRPETRRNPASLARAGPELGGLMADRFPPPGPLRMDFREQQRVP